MEVDLSLMGIRNGDVEGQLLFKEREACISGAWRTAGLRKTSRAEDTGHVSKLCVN